jgi:hypothetical protein
MRKLGEGGLMGRVSWSDQAEADLDRMALAVADQLRRNTEEILHDIPPVEYQSDEGELPNGIMWHRGAAHESLSEHDGGPQDYAFLYRRQDSNPESEILAVPSTKEIASKYAQMTKEPRDTDYAQSL